VSVQNKSEKITLNPERKSLALTTKESSQREEDKKSSAHQENKSLAAE